MKKKKYPLYFQVACVLISLCALVYIIILGKDILTPLVFGAILSILMMPLASFFETNWRFHRGAASATALVCMIVLVVSVFFLVGSQISTLASDWPSFKQQLSLSFHDLQLWVSKTFKINAAKQLTYLNSVANTALNSGSSVVGTTLLSVSSMLFFLIFIFLYTFFLLLYRARLKRFLVTVFQDENAYLVHEIIEQVQVIIRKYITGLLIEMGIVASVVSLAFWAMGIKYALLLGVLTGLFNLVPYIGIFTALLLSALITFATASGIKVLLVAITIFAMHLIDSNVLLPLIVGSKVRINALATVLGVVLGEMIWGLPGMFLSIPVIAVLKIIFDRVESLQVWGILLGDEQEAKNS